MKFKSQLIEDQKKRVEEKSINLKVIDISEIKNIDEDVYGLYPTVGENLDYINSNKLNRAIYPLATLYTRIAALSLA